MRAEILSPKRVLVHFTDVVKYFRSYIIYADSRYYILTVRDYLKCPILIYNAKLSNLRNRCRIECVAKR